MAGTRSEDVERPHILLGILESVEQDGAQSQRRLASKHGIALGLVNAYLKRCIKKGLVKMSEAPARRYAYYLTPQGFAEKSRLTVEYLSYSFGFFRQAKADCAALLKAAIESGHSRIVLAGKSDLAEIAAICAAERSVQIVGIVDPATNESRFAGIPVATSFDSIEGHFDAVMVTDLQSARDTCEKLIDRFGTERVLIPELLRLRIGTRQEQSA